MIQYKLLPQELHESAATIFDAAFASKFRSILSCQNDRAKIYRLMFSRVPIIYIEEDNVLKGMLVPSTYTSTKAFTSRDILLTLGLCKGLFPAILTSIIRHKTPQGSVCVEFLAVDTQQRGKGVGTKLFDYVQNWAIGNSYSNIILDVVDSNHNAKKLYNRIGFVDVRITKLGFLSRMLGWDFTKIYSMKKELNAK